MIKIKCARLALLTWIMAPITYGMESSPTQLKEATRDILSEPMPVDMAPITYGMESSPTQLKEATSDILSVHTPEDAANGSSTQHTGCSDRPILEFRVSYFRPSSKTFREVFHNGGVNYALETTIPVSKGLNVWSQVDYFSREGKMEGIDKSAQVTIVPI